MKKLCQDNFGELPGLTNLLVSVLRSSSDPGRDTLCRAELSGGKRNLKKENNMELVKEHENRWAAAKTRGKSSKNKQPSVNNKSEVE